MANKGKYVRPSDDVESETGETSPSLNAGDVSPNCDGASESDYSEDNSESNSDCELDGQSNATTDTEDSTQKERGNTSMQSNTNTPTITQPNPCNNDAEDPKTNERLQRMEKVLADLSQAICFLKTSTQATAQLERPSLSAQFSNDTDQTWISSSGLGSLATASSNIRWDNIKPFPTGVPANKLWEEWNRYIENFEIAATLNNANDPVRRSQLLFLSIGDELQGIVRAAQLRPNLNTAGCYETFVSNIKNYFQSMTDTAAEHEAFSSMKQGKDESAIAFHARLMGKVRLCGYSKPDQDRFVRAQFLKGMRNRDLAKSARTYGYDTNFIVQAATRDEAFGAEAAEAAEQNVYAVNQGNHQSAHIDTNKKRTYSDAWTNRPLSKRPRKSSQNVSRRSRCNRCNRFRHNNYPCPALNKQCNSCGERGHFAAMCR